jgi:hypothetical protein
MIQLTTFGGFCNHTAVHHFLHIITQPDNIAIVVMMVSTIICTAVAFREIRINDKLIKSGKKEQIYERMAK